MISFSCEDNDVVALRAFASAMILIADERPEGGTVTVTETTSLGDAVHKTETVTETGIPATGAVTTGSGAVETETTKPTMEQGAAVVNAQTGPNGVRWDARIHSRTKSLDGQGNFKLMRKPNSYATKEDWQTFVSEVEAQLKGATMSSPTGTTVPNNDGEPDPSKVGFGDTPPGGMFDKGASDPTPPNLETTTPTPPALEAADNTAITFQQVMKTMTANKSKITAAQLLGICQAYGIDKVVSIKDQEPEIIGAIYAEMMAVINGA